LFLFAIDSPSRDFALLSRAYLDLRRSWRENLKVLLRREQYDGAADLYGTCHMRRLLLATTMFAAFAGAACAGGGVSVHLDEVRIVTFAKPVTTLYVGNPMIADVTIIDDRHAFVQGKAYGSTNFLGLDSTGHQILDEQIVVAGNSSAVVTLQRGNQQTTYACAAARCQSAPQPGDGKDSYDEAAGQIVKHQMLAKAAAAGTQ
jgi:hypothetical protein